MVQSYCHNTQTYEPACFFLAGWRLQLSAFTRGRYWVFHIIRICSFKITYFPAHFVLCKDTLSVQTLYHLWSKDSSGEYSVNVGSQTSFYHDEVKRTTRWPRSLKWQATCFMKSEVAQSCGAFCNPMDCSLPGSSILRIFQARVVGWLAISFCRGSSWSGDQTHVSHTAGRCFTLWTTREAHWIHW